MKAVHLAARLRQAAALRAEGELSRRRAAEADAIRAEAGAAAAIAGEIAAWDAQCDADALAAWLAAARTALARARVARADAARQVQQAQVQLAAADVARAAIEELIERRACTAAVRVMRAQQVAMDDWAGRPREGPHCPDISG